MLLFKVLSLYADKNTKVSRNPGTIFVHKTYKIVLLLVYLLIFPTKNTFQQTFSLNLAVSITHKFYPVVYEPDEPSVYSD